MQVIQIGETAIDIPSMLDWRDDEGTVVAYLPETDFANLRFSLLSVRDESGNLIADAGGPFVTKRCAEFDAHLEAADQLVWFHYTKPATEGSQGSLMHYWYVGMNAYVLIISCFIEATMEGDPNTALVLSSVEPTIRSFRKYQGA